MILVTGATGTVGSQLVSDLRARGSQVRALVRDAHGVSADDGVEYVVGDLGDSTSVAAALSGVQVIYLLVPAAKQMMDYGRTVIEAATASQERPRVVLHAAAGIQQRSADVRFLAAHAAAWDRLRASGLSWTVLAPNGFFQNFLTMRPQLADGVLALPAGEAPVSYVDASDVAAAAAVVLTTNGHDEATYTLTGPASLTHAQIADELSAIVGRGVKYDALDAPQARVGLIAAGVDPWLAEGLIELYGLYSSGAAAGTSEDLPRLLGRPARSFTTFLSEHVRELA